MRHNKKGRKLGTSWSHTKAMKRNLVAALFLNDRIKTIDMRAKEIRPDVDRIITWAKRGDLHSRRLAIAYLGDKDLVREIFEKVEQGMFKDRPGGYTRIMKLGNRKGDNAPMVIMELVTEPVKFKKDKKSSGASKTTQSKASNKKATPKRVEESDKADEADEADEAKKSDKADKADEPAPEEAAQEEAEDSADESADNNADGAADEAESEDAADEAAEAESDEAADEPEDAPAEDDEASDDEASE